jgi:calcineurin-like phosphoesterase family protein
MSNLFFTSDTHWGHTNIIKYSQRPFENVVDMNFKLIQYWNAVVGPKDTVWHLGDFAFMQFPQFKNVLRQLNGSINFIFGNHDKMIDQNYEEIMRMGKIRSMQNYAEVKINGKMFCLFHYGQRVWNKSHHGSIHLYGHSHGSLPPHGLSVDVGVDCKEITPEYRPIHLDEVLKYMAGRQPAVVDHHGMQEE